MSFFWSRALGTSQPQQNEGGVSKGGECFGDPVKDFFSNVKTVEGVIRVSLVESVYALIRRLNLVGIGWLIRRPTQ